MTRRLLPLGALFVLTVAACREDVTAVDNTANAGMDELLGAERSIALFDQAAAFARACWDAGNERGCVGVVRGRREHQSDLRNFLFYAVSRCTPRDTIPGDSTPGRLMPPDTMPRDTMPRDTVPRDTIPRDTIPRDTIPRDTIPRDTIPRDTVPRDTIPRDTIPRDTIPRDTIPRDTIPRDTIPHDTVPPDTIPPRPMRCVPAEAGYGEIPEKHLATGGDSVFVTTNTTERANPQFRRLVGRGGDVKVLWRRVTDTLPDSLPRPLPADHFALRPSNTARLVRAHVSGSVAGFDIVNPVFALIGWLGPVTVAVGTAATPPR